ncbi:MAG: hypothetical protein AB7H88_08195 [Vicinamibacterales bacterium]
MNSLKQQLRADLLAEVDGLQEPGTRKFRDPERVDHLLTLVEALDGRQGASEQARAEVLDMLATRSDAVGIDSKHAGGPAGRGGSHETIPLMAEAIAHRYTGGTLSDAARPYRNLRLADMARHLLEARGIHARHESDLWVVQRTFAGHTTSDFPSLLTETGNRVLRQAYDAAQSGVRAIARQTTARDFRPLNKLSLSAAPGLLKVNEHAEITRGTMAATKESYSLETYARIFALSRNAIINDDLGAFVDFTRRQGQVAAELVASKLVALLTSNPTMSDSTALFHADHANLGTAAVINVTSLGEALSLMRLQTVAMDDGTGGTNGTMPINAVPKFLLVPAALEVVAKQYVAQVNATKASDINPFSSELEVVVDPRLDASSATAWYLAADPAVIDTLEYAYLDDAPGPQYAAREGFDIMGVEMRVSLDFGCGVLDWRGLVKNAGA